MIGADLRYTLRTLAKQRGFTAVAVLTLAIALAANTAIFSVVNAILLRPLPFAAPGQLANLTAASTTGAGDFPVYSYPNFMDLQRDNKSFEQLIAFTRGRTFLMEGNEPELLGGLDITANFLAMLGVHPQLGRTFNADEDREGGPLVMIISHELWQRRFNGDRNIIGRSVRMGTGGQSRTVVGVLPPGFRFPANEVHRDYFTPFHEEVGPARDQRDAIWISVAGKMRPGVTLEQANAELKTLSQRLQKQFPTENAGLVFVASSMHETVVRDVRPALLMLFSAVAVVLLIGCANVANLLLARATARHKEISIRAALGASPARITVQLLVESLVLSLIAGAAGLLLASWGIDALLAFAPANIPRLDTISLDGRVLLFTTLLSVFTGIAFGLAPAISASRPNLTEALKEGTRGSTEGKRNRLRSILVVSAVAMSLMLLAGAGLLLRSFIHVTGIDPGYDYRNAATMSLSPRTLLYPDDAKSTQFHVQLLEAVQNTPGVTSAGAMDALPMGSSETFWSFNIVGKPDFAPGTGPSARTVAITPNLIATMRIPLLRGRDLSKHDVEGKPNVLLVNETFARQVFPNEEVLGRKLRFNSPGQPEDVGEIVGVVGDARWRSLTEEPQPMMFVPVMQRPRRFMSYVVRGAQAESLGPSLRATVRRIDPQQPIADIGTLMDLRSNSLATRRFNLILLAVLAAVALVLAAVGIFSVMNYAVTQRTTEIGIRMALGAEQRDVFKLIVGNAARLVMIGAVIGVVGALLSSRAIGTLMYGVKPTDPWTFAAIVVVIAGTALLASYLPARRAAKVDPLVAIRYD